MSHGPWKKPATNFGLFAVPVAVTAMLFSGLVLMGANMAYFVWPEIAPRSTERKSNRFLANQKVE